MLSLLLPVRDAQGILDRQVHEILELMAENEHLFELLIIDDGSTDATIEVAYELCQRYPQVRCLRHSVPLGREKAVLTGLKHCHGKVVMLVEEGRRFSVLRRLERRKDRPTDMPPARPKYLNRLKSILFGHGASTAPEPKTDVPLGV